VRAVVRQCKASNCDTSMSGRGRPAVSGRTLQAAVRTPVTDSSVRRLDRKTAAVNAVKTKPQQAAWK